MRKIERDPACKPICTGMARAILQLQERHDKNNHGAVRFAVACASAFKLPKPAVNPVNGRERERREKLRKRDEADFQLAQEFDPCCVRLKAVAVADSFDDVT